MYKEITQRQCHTRKGLVPFMTPGRTWLVSEAGFEVPALSSIPFSTCRYEEEVALRATAENEFVVLKKVRVRLQGRE